MRTPYQKEKLLKILELLLHETDENHPMNASEISNRLRSDLGEEYVVDRKSVGSDVQLVSMWAMTSYRSREERVVITAQVVNSICRR